MSTLDPAALPATEPAAIRRIDEGDLRWALGEGWRDMREKRGDIVFIGLLYPLICIITVFVTLGTPLLPLFFPLVAGVSIAGPAVASGFYEIARRREEGRDSSWRHFFDPVRGPARDTLMTLTLGLAVLFVAWLAFAWAIYEATLAREAPRGVGGFVDALFTTDAGWTMIIAGNLVGAAFALVTLVFALVSFPMAVDKPVDAGAAVRTSLAAFRRNPRAVLSWGARVALLLLLGCLPAGIGLAFVLPWLGYATWHLYTRLVVR